LSDSRTLGCIKGFCHSDHVVFLGFVVSAKGVQVDAEKVKAIQ